MSEGKYQRQANGKEPRLSNGRTPRGTSGGPTDCCCAGGAVCPVCSGDVPEVWEGVYSGITKCPAFTFIPDPNRSFTNISGLTVSTGGPGGDGCSWAEGDGTYTATLSMQDNSGSPTHETHLTWAGVGSQPFRSGNIAFGGDCTAGKTFSNSNTLGTCDSSRPGYGGTAVMTPVFPP